MNSLTLPHNLDAEADLLGALLNGTCPTTALACVRFDDLYKNGHRYVLESIFELAANSERFDVVTVADNLRKAGRLESVGGASYLAEIAGRITPNVESRIKIIAEKAKLRKIILASQKMLAQAQSEQDPAEIVAAAEREIFDLARESKPSKARALKEVFKDAMADMKGRIEGKIVGIPCGLANMDKNIGGFHAGDLVILAGRTSRGKSSLALTMAYNMVYNLGVSVLLFSFEMDAVQVAQRIISMDSHVGILNMRNGKFGEREWKKITGSMKKLSGGPLYLDDGVNADPVHVRTQAREWRSRINGNAVIMVDYLQLMDTRSRESRTMRLGSISRGLKLLAKELDCPVVCLSQLSREVDKEKRPPRLTDLRESGSIEQDADLVLFVNKNRDDHKGAEHAEIYIAKHRHGPLGKCHLSFVKALARFYDSTKDEAP